MLVRDLIMLLSELPLDATVHLDDDGYPEVKEVHSPKVSEYEGDPEDAPPVNSVLLEVTYARK